MVRWIILLFSVNVFLNVNAATNLTSMSHQGIDKWQSKQFSGESIYTTGDYKGRLALKALSHKTASGLMLEQQIDLSATPYINWSWLVEKPLLQLNERSKTGDDFAARIYVVIDGGFMVWNTKSLNYVWSSNQDKGLVWNNAFAGSSVKMMSVRGKESQTGLWYEEKRNVYQDLIDTFGDQGSDKANRKAYQYIDIIAIMTDTDNSGKQAESYYGDIIFSEK
ncbi:DUF3047 domain-containing protein [Shewanella livingstonensis]|uniref:DUF3047 domain-containing protein n=1 Tax=Shewanella livingstonensis TaxID=150120 RepID=A0A3G8LUP3_9GAMM|nr:DUF3047 domain-containing protein [Shewanella livingstonensis]AZG72935.1 DUF3047 domain-containing protein [Shewanella livingstonensis]